MDSPKDWSSLTHTRAILVCVDPVMPFDIVEARLDAAESDIAVLEAYCDEMGIDCPGVAVSVEGGIIALEFETPKDRMRYNQVVAKMRQMAIDQLRDH